MESGSNELQENEKDNGNDLCMVCGSTANVAMHYGAQSCVGCKGFFRRALMKADQLECSGTMNCAVSKNLRTQCRYCRFHKCLRVGMNPAFVRPNRDLPPKSRKIPSKSQTPPLAVMETDELKLEPKAREDWMKKMSVEIRTMLMTLLNIETKTMKGDTSKSASEIYPLKGHDKLRNFIEEPARLKGKRSEMRYEPYRLANNEELSVIVYRRLIAAVDWVESLSGMIGDVSVDDKMALVKNAFIPLMVFNFAARTSEVSEKNVLCLCNFAYVPRNISKMYQDTYHLGNNLVGKVIDQLVEPYRQYGMTEEEIVCINAIICLNPLARDLSPPMFERIVDLRNKIQDCLFAIVKEIHKTSSTNVTFGHLLLSLPTVSLFSTEILENIQFAQTFSTQGEIPLLTDLFGCFEVEPFDEEEVPISDLSLGQTWNRHISTQTDRVPVVRPLKRHATETVEEMSPTRHSFKLLQAPNNFYITEILDDLKNNPEETTYYTMSPATEFFDPTQPSSSMPRTASTNDLGGSFHNNLTRTASLQFSHQNPYSYPEDFRTCQEQFMNPEQPPITVSTTITQTSGFCYHQM